MLFFLVFIVTTVLVVVSSSKVEFTAKPRSQIVLPAGSQMPELVWKFDLPRDTYGMTLYLEKDGKKSIIARMVSSAFGWENKSNRIYIVGPSIVLFVNPASNEDEGIYIMQLNVFFADGVESSVNITVIGGVEFLGQPPEALVVHINTSLPALEWQPTMMNETRMKIYRARAKDVSSSSEFKSPRVVAWKNASQPWTVYEPGVNVVQPATLVYENPIDEYFVEKITLEVQGPLSTIESHVTVTVVGIAFTKEPPKNILVHMCEPIPDLVWQYNSSDDKMAYVEARFASNLLPEFPMDVASKDGSGVWKAAPIYDDPRRLALQKRLTVVHQATIRFNGTASKEDAGQYSIFLESPYLLGKRESIVTLTVSDGYEAETPRTDKLLIHGPKPIRVLMKEKIPPLKWVPCFKNLSVNMTIYRVRAKDKSLIATFGVNEIVAKKTSGQGWKALVDGVQVNEPATLVYKSPVSEYFMENLTLVVTGPRSTVSSSVVVTVVGIAFIEEPKTFPQVHACSSVHDMVWKFYDSDDNVRKIEAEFVPKDRPRTIVRLASKRRGESWKLDSNNRPYFGDKVSVVDQATIRFNGTASKKDEGLYRIVLESPSLLPHLQKSEVTLTVLGECSTGFYLTKMVVPAVGGCIAVLLVFIFFWYRRRKTLRLSFRTFDNEEDGNEDEVRWDMFISYSSKDFAWAKRLWETLEKPPFNLSVCIHQRDWEVGRSVIDNMADSVYHSHKTLVVMSKNYLDSKYCMQELQMAMHREMSSGGDSNATIIPVVVDGMKFTKLPKALRQKSFLDFSDEEHAKHLKENLWTVFSKARRTSGKSMENC